MAQLTQQQLDENITALRQQGASESEINEYRQTVSVKQEAKKASVVSRVLDTGTRVSDFFGGRGISELVGAKAAQIMATPEERAAVKEFGSDTFNAPPAREIIGSALQVGSSVIPIASSGSLLARIGTGALAGYGIGTGAALQDKEQSIGEALTPGAETAIGATLPLAGVAIKPATNLVGRLFKGLGSGLSGVSQKAIEEIIENPRVAQAISNRIKESGGTKILQENTQKIVNGIRTIRQQARAAYAKGLESLKGVDVDPKVFRQQTQAFFDKIGSSVKDGVRTITNVEFDDPKNLEKANKMLDRLFNAKLDGVSLRKLVDDISNMRYKVATSDERLAFNAFVDDLSNAVKGAISKSTGKLDDINKAFTEDMQLVEAMEGIFGKVKFANLKEFVNASKKLEQLFAQKGFAPEVVDRFFARLGDDISTFRTSESVRQIGEKVTGANAKGLSIAETLQQLTSAIITPNAVKNLSIMTGIAKESLVPFFQALRPAARNIIINALINEKKD